MEYQIIRILINTFNSRGIDLYILITVPTLLCYVSISTMNVSSVMLDAKLKKNIIRQILNCKMVIIKFQDIPRIQQNFKTLRLKIQLHLLVIIGNGTFWL